MKKRGGFTLMEMLVSVTLLSGVMIGMTTIITAIGARFAADIQIQHADRGAARIMGEFTVAMKQAISVKIYADRTTWQAAPNSTAASGNFVLINTAAGREYGFELAGGSVNIINNPSGVSDVLTCCISSSVTAAGTFIFQQNGVPSMAWIVSLPTERMQFQTAAQPLYMQ
jgi:prepilin-type N-terminal cleavage/methylation domain-containing protein